MVHVSVWSRYHLVGLPDRHRLVACSRRVRFFIFGARSIRAARAPKWSYRTVRAAGTRHVSGEIWIAWPTARTRPECSAFCGLRTDSTENSGVSGLGRLSGDRLGLSHGIYLRGHLGKNMSGLPINTVVQDRLHRISEETFLQSPREGFRRNLYVNTRARPHLPWASRPSSGRNLTDQSVWQAFGEEKHPQLRCIGRELTPQ